MQHELEYLYAVVVLTGVDPARAGYLVRRGRIVIIGIRADKVEVSQLSGSAMTTMEFSMPPPRELPAAPRLEH